MNTDFQSVYDMFLSNITSYDYLDLTETELNTELKMIMRKALAKCLNFDDVKADYILEEFNRELTELEINIIANFMIIEWLNPQITSEEKLKMRLGSKDYTTYSPANLLKQLQDIRNDARKEAHYWSNLYSWKKRAKEKIK